MRHIVLTQMQRDKIMDYRSRFIHILSERNVDISPVKLIDGTYILPEKILADPAYADLIPKIDIGTVIIREVSPDEIDKTGWDL